LSDIHQAYPKIVDDAPRRPVGFGSTLRQEDGWILFASEEGGETPQSGNRDDKSLGGDGRFLKPGCFLRIRDRWGDMRQFGFPEQNRVGAPECGRIATMPVKAVAVPAHL